jgi:hypothetical protein
MLYVIPQLRVKENTGSTGKRRHRSQANVVKLKNFIFWDITLCSTSKVRQSKRAFLLLHAKFAWLILLPKKMKVAFSSQIQLTFNGLISKNIEFFITTAVKTSNSTSYIL